MKITLLREALRVTRAKLFVLEDTPTTAFDRYVSQRHGDAYRRKIDSDAAFGFLTPAEWQWLFRGMASSPKPTSCRVSAAPSCSRLRAWPSRWASGAAATWPSDFHRLLTRVRQPARVESARPVERQRDLALGAVAVGA